MYYNKKKTIIIVMIAAIMLMATGYAYFATQLNITSTGNITSSWLVEFTGIDVKEKSTGASITPETTPQASGATAIMSADLTVPGDYIIYELTLKNSGSVPAYISEINAKAEGSGAIVFSITGIVEGNADVIRSQEERKIEVKIEYDTNVVDDPENKSKILTVSIVAAQYIDPGDGGIGSVSPSIDQPVLLSSAILNNNTAQADTNIDFSRTSYATGTNGLYYTATNTEDNKTTYYFRGDVDNNYVDIGLKSGVCKYGDIVVLDMTWGTIVDESTCTSGPVCVYGDQAVVGFDESLCEMGMSGSLQGEASWVPVTQLWKIIRINEDGSIRLMKDEPIGTKSAFGSGIQYNAYVGYMYGTLDSDNYKDTHTNTNDSTVKTALDAWYKENLEDNFSHYLADAGFCNDRSVASSANSWVEDDTALGYGTSITYYGAYNRIVNESQPQFACPQTNDLFTTSSSSKGNRALTYPIGLITADEVVYAGETYNQRNENIYLPNYSVQYWTMSPFNLSSENGSSEWAVDYFGAGLFKASNGLEYSVYPVINLKSNIGVNWDRTGNLGEPGTRTNPYIIKTS